MALTKLNNQSLGAVTSAGIPIRSGTVLQILNAKSTALLTTSNTTNSWTDLPGMTLTITPASTNSKILISYTNHIYVQGASNQSWNATGIRLLRSTTVVQTDGDSSYGTSHILTGTNDRFMVHQAGQYLDSPNTTSAVTYHLEAATTQSTIGNIINNPSYGSGGQITLTEIAG